MTTAELESERRGLKTEGRNGAEVEVGLLAAVQLRLECLEVVEPKGLSNRPSWNGKDIHSLYTCN